MSTPSLPLPAPDRQRERLRQQRAWYVYDWANSAFFTTVGAVLFGPYLTVVAKRAACPGQDTDLTCTTNLSVLGIPVSPGSLALYTVTAGTILSAILLPMVGAIADRTGRKRSLMAGLAWTGSAAAAGLFFLSGDTWQLGVVLQMIAAICAGASLVVYDAILIDIAEPHERDAVSSKGWAAGYAGGAILLALNLVLITAHDSFGITDELAVRISLCSAGVWWAAFTIIPFLVLRDGPSPASADGDGPPERAGHSFGQLVQTLRHARQYPQTLLFLVAYLFFNDGIQTVIYASSIYGQEQLGLPAERLVLAILVVQIVAFAGALVFGRVAARVGAQRTILASLVLWCVVISVGYLLPRGQLLPFLALAILIGLVLGGTQALARSSFSLLIPRGREAEYFSLYQATERGTSWAGTLLFGLVFQLTTSYRYSIVALVLFFLIGGILLSRVDMARAIDEAGNTRPAVI